MAESFSGGKCEPLLARQELPGPADRVALEIVAEAEVAQHLEEGVVIGRAADVVDVAGAEAFLAGRGPGELELAAAEEVVLELVHAGRGEQHRGVPSRHQHVAGPADAALGLEEGQIFFAEFVGFHGNLWRQCRWQNAQSNPQSYPPAGVVKSGAGGVATALGVADNGMRGVKRGNGKGEKGEEEYGYHGARPIRGTAGAGRTGRFRRQSI